jgi:hypothetical protein
MTRRDDDDACAVCGDELPEDPPDVMLPTRFAPRMTPLAGPGIRRVEFCSERHRRDWLDARRGEWPDTDDESDPDN